MPYKDKNKAREYQREYARKQRSGALVVRAYNTRVLDGAVNPTLATIDDLRTVFERITNEVLNADLDLGIKGRILAQLLTVGIKLVEGTDIERRISELEKRAELSKYA